MIKALLLFLYLFPSGMIQAQERSFEQFYDSLKAAAAPYKTYRFEWVREETFYNYPVSRLHSNKIIPAFNFLRAKKQIDYAPDFIFRVVVQANDISPIKTLFAGTDRYIDYYLVSFSYRLDVYFEVVPRTGKSLRIALVENWLVEKRFKTSIEDRNRKILFEKDIPQPVNFGETLDHNLFRIEQGLKKYSPFFQDVEELLHRFLKKGKL